MGKRRRGNDFEGLAVLVAVVIFAFGTVIISFLKTVLLVLLIGGGAALGCFILYRLGRTLWARQLDIESYLPDIQWNSPVVTTFDNTWINIRYPEFSAPILCPVPNVIGTSGAWKDVVGRLERFPPLRTAVGPKDLQERVRACEAASADILRWATVAADENARQKQIKLEQQVQQLRDAVKDWEFQAHSQLEMLECLIGALHDGSFLERVKANRLRSHQKEYEIRLNKCRQEAGERERTQVQAIRNFLDPAQRERTLRERINQELAIMKAVVASREFAGAAAEVAVIDELRSLPAGSLIFNDVRLVSGRYIRFEGKPLQSAQIDTLVITPAGVFVVEVKNWSRTFADSGEGFNPYEQVNRASYLVFDQLRKAGMAVKVRGIIATQGSLPAKGDQKVAVVPIGRLRGYIERAEDTDVDVPKARLALGL